MACVAWFCLYGWFACSDTKCSKRVAGLNSLIWMVWSGWFDWFGVIGVACSVGSNALVWLAWSDWPGWFSSTGAIGLIRLLLRA